MTHPGRCFAILVLLLPAQIVPPAWVHAAAQLPISGNSPAERWIASWAAAQQIVEPQNTLPAESVAGGTLRQIVHLSVGGARIRLRVSNEFGRSPLHLLGLHVARPLSPAASRIDPKSDRTVRFDERDDVLIPEGAAYTSDPLDYPVTALSDLAITLHVEAAPEQQTGHPGSRSTSYIAKGTSLGAAELQGQSVEHWYWVSGVAVSGAPEGSAIATLGDSTTDGRGATTNGNDRWPDVLAARLQRSRATSSVGVVNIGIGGNHLLADALGPNALARFDRDVLARDGVRYLIVLEGINDLGGLTRTNIATQAQHEELVRRMIGSLRQIVLRAHANGIKVIGGTVMPFMGSEFYHPGPANESDRQALNAWIRAPGHFDAVVDFDRITADPAHPDRYRPEYDCGDHLHPSPAGYRAMAEAIPLELFQN